MILIGEVEDQMKKKIINKYTQRYHNCFNKLIRLDYLERYLLDWLAEQADSDKDNKVKTTVSDRAEFINFILRVSSQEGVEFQIIYKDSSVKRALNTLRNHKFLIQPPERMGRGWAWLNPEYYWNGSPLLRANVINMIERELNE